MRHSKRLADYLAGRPRSRRPKEFGATTRWAACWSRISLSSFHCYTTPTDISDPDRLTQLGDFCRRMGREAHQGEIGLVIGDEYLAFRDFSKE